MIMDKNKDFLIGKMSNEDELAIYGSILGAIQSINYNDKLIDNVAEAVDDADAPLFPDSFFEPQKLTLSALTSKV